MNRPNERRRRPQPENAATMIARKSYTCSQDAQPCHPRQPSTFGLTPRELYLEAVTLYANGWTLDEIRAVLALPSEVLR